MFVDTAAGVTVLRTDGVFDVPAARRLAGSLASAGSAEVRVDLTGVREFHDSGIALLARAIAERRAPTAVQGLQEHHLRLLRYLGFDVGTSASGVALR